MREVTSSATAATEEPNWFARWEEDLPTPEELMPLSQTLITPDLALAFDIPNSSNTPNNPHISNPTPPPQFPSSDFDSDLAGSGAGAAGEEPARTLKRPRLVWTPQLHKRFVDAVAHIGIKNAVPKTIMQLMSVDGLTRENVASHLQKYRLYLKRMQGLSSGGGGCGVGGGTVGPMSAADAATDQLFASGPIPRHFLRGGGSGQGHGVESFGQFVPMATALQHHQHMAAAAAAQQYYQNRQGIGGFDHGFLTPAQPGLQRIVQQPVVVGPIAGGGSYVDDLEERSGGGGGGGRKVLTLFPTGDD